MFIKVGKVGRIGSVTGSSGSIISGVPPITTNKRKLISLKAFGGTEQRSILPREYTQVEYLESTGTQYIDLGYKGNGNTKVEVKFKYFKLSSVVGSGRVFGSRVSLSNNAFAIGTDSGTVAETSTNKLFWCYDAQSPFRIDEEFGLNVWKTVVFSAKEHSINGLSVGDDYNIVEFETSENLKLFGFDNQGIIGFGYVDIAYCKLWDNGVLVRDLIPAKNNSNVLGMYDIVTGNFLTNAGTGTFIAGADVTTPSLEIPMDIWCNNGVLKVSRNLFKANVSDIRQNANPSSSIRINFDKWYAGVAYNGYMVINDIISFSSGVGTITFTSKDGVYGCAKFFKLKPNTNYIVSCSSPTNNHKCAIMCYIDNGDDTYTATTQIKFPELLPVQFKTNDNVVYGILLYSPKNTSITYTDLQLEEGSVANPYMPYGQIYADGIVETINVHGKNFFDAYNWTLLDDSKIEIIDANKMRISYRSYQELYNYFALPSHKQVMKLSFHYKTLRIYNDNSFFQISIGTGSLIQIRLVSLYYEQDFVISIPVNTNQLKIGYWGYDGGVELSNIQLELGSTVTEYEPCFDGGTATAEMLLKVGDYQDEQEILSGAVTRNVGVKAFDGTEDWGWINAESHVWRGTAYLNNLNGLNGSGVISTHFAPLSMALASNYFYIKYLADYNITSIQAWKQYLADQYANGTPVIIVYPLAKPTTEQVAGQTLELTRGTNIIDITQASLDNLELEVKAR